MKTALSRQFRFSPYSLFALVISLLAVLVTGALNAVVFEGIPHIEDEMAYVWQAQAIAAGHIKLESPPCPSCFLVPFVVDQDGFRFGKYPLAWPVVLAIGIKLGIRGWVNPLLAGLGVWLTYRLGQKVAGRWVGALAAFLTLASPFFLINSGLLLSHPWSLVLSLAFTLAWLDTFGFQGRQPSLPPALTVVSAGLCLGAQALTRPLTAVGIALPFFIHGILLLARGPLAVRQRVLWIGAIALATALLIFPIRYVLTGSFTIDPYTLWWPYDTIGLGPGVGLLPQGHTLEQGLSNTRWSLWVGASDFFGWGQISWLFLPFGVWALFRAGRLARSAWLVMAVFLSLVFVYIFYWTGAWLFGPRYYFESFFSLTILTAIGIRWLIGLPIFSNAPQGLPLLRPAVILGVVSFLICANLLYYLPGRLNGLTGLYGVEKSHILPFQTTRARSMTPALVIVHPRHSWIEYGTLLDLTDANLTSPYIITIDQGPGPNQQVIDAFPDRTVIHYYPDEPYTFYFPKK
jgi:hypothetical protein